MKKQIVALSLVLVSAMLSATGATVTVDKVQQRYPWNGLVDIDYTVKLGAGESFDVDDFIEFTARDESVTPAREQRAAAISGGLLPLAEGTRRVTWDAQADGFTSFMPRLTITGRLVTRPARYMVVDLSAGSGATTYRVDYLDGEPQGGFCTDEYRGNKLVLRRIVPSAFIAGSPTTEKNRKAENEGQHSVVISKPFYIGIFETTQKQYENVSGKNNPASVYPGDYRPKENVSYNDLIGAYSRTKWPDTDEVDSTTFFGKLRAKTSGLAFFLPTEAQWEYACRAGTTSDFGNGVVCANTDEQTAQMRLLGRFVNNQVEDGSGYATYHTTVGSYQPNAYGLYDMHGNVWELCCDWWRPNVAELEQLVDPRGGMVFRYGRVERGGGYGSAASDCRSASRAELSVGNNGTAQRSESCGFRLVLPVND